MYDIRQFLPSLYLLVLLGFSGFTLAAQAPGLWLLAVTLTLVNAYLVRHNLFRPLPRFVANALTIGTLLLVALRIRTFAAPPIMVIGEFLVIIQLIKLYEQRANRDYAQLLILSLLLMVAASINTASLLFGVMLIAFLFLALWCCLLFHLKVETDYARKAMNLTEANAHPVTLRQDQRHLSRSMRRLTGSIAVVAVVMAVVVFVLFPRGPGQGLFGQQLQFRPAEALTGFSGELSLDSISRIQENPAVVARVKLWKNEEPVNGGVLYLRATTSDVYDDRPGYWSWSRSTRDDEPAISIRAGERLGLNEPPTPDRWRQEVMLEPTGQTPIFALAGVTSITPGRDMRFRFSVADHTLYSAEAITQQVRYEVTSSGEIPSGTNRYSFLSNRFPAERMLIRARDTMGLPPPEMTESMRLTREIAIRPEVSGAGDDGESLGQRRLRVARVSELDVEIANNIQRYLLSNFTYTLDLSGRSRDRNVDPIVWFLEETKSGHCEYFASAMVRLCQSLGIQARTVTGFKCDNYNVSGGYFIVQQLHAHAWVEVLTPTGWMTFDPTAARTDEASKKPTGLWARVKHFFDFLEYTWADSVVAYDQDSRQNLLQTVDTQLTNTAINSGEKLRDVKSWFNAVNFYLVSSSLLSLLIWLMILALMVAIAWFAIERWRLMRRAKRIGLDALPSSEQKRLARQLGFYDDLLKLLEKRGIHRKPHQTPLEFSNSISFLPAEVFDAVRRLTRIFYRVRYGNGELGPGRRRLLSNVIERIERAETPGTR
jgi:transglutaminase-like putative cysteine protease